MFSKVKKKLFFINFTFLILYFFFNLLDGERGLFSYFKKKEVLISLQNKEIDLTNKIKDFEFKNSLLSDKLDLRLCRNFNKREIFIWQRR